MDEICGAVNRHHTEAVCGKPANHDMDKSNRTHLAKPCRCGKRAHGYGGFGWTEIIDLERWNAEGTASMLEYINQVFDDRDALREENEQLRQQLGEQKAGAI